MGKYSLFATKEDYQKQYDLLKQLEIDLKEKFDWTKIKRSSLDQVTVLVSILQRKLIKQRTTN